MNRRCVIALLGGMAAAWPMAARAQQPALPVIGFLHSASAAAYTRLVASFRKGLNEAGYSEGQNVAIEFRCGEGRNERLLALAAELVHRLSDPSIPENPLAFLRAPHARVVVQL
jgi:putative tryptophan/tyrosine transport system substrate-binding protein